MQPRRDLAPVVLVKRTIMDRIKIISMLAFLSLLFFYSFNIEGKNNYEDTDDNMHKGTSAIFKTELQLSFSISITNAPVRFTLDADRNFVLKIADVSLCILPSVSS